MTRSCLQTRDRKPGVKGTGGKPGGNIAHRVRYQKGRGRRNLSIGVQVSSVLRMDIQWGKLRSE